MGRFYMQPEDVIIRRALAEGELRGLYRFEQTGGVTVRMTMARTRRSQNDLVQLFEDVSNAIEAEAIKLTDEELMNNPRNPRNANYPWRRSGGRMRYSQGFRTRAGRRIGRPSVTISNVAQSARFVEEGNDREGEYIYARGKWMTVPLKKDIGRVAWNRGRPTKYSQIRRVTQGDAHKAGLKRMWMNEMGSEGTPLLILKRGDNYFWLTDQVKTYEGYRILERALIAGLPKGLAIFRQRK